MSYVNKQGNVVKSFFEVNGNLIYPVTHNLIDMFWGRGFTSHARFKFNTQHKAWVLWKKNAALPKDLDSILQEFQELAKKKGH